MADVRGSPVAASRSPRDFLRKWWSSDVEDKDAVLLQKEENMMGKGVFSIFHGKMGCFTQSHLTLSCTNVFEIMSCMQPGDVHLKPLQILPAPLSMQIIHTWSLPVMNLALTLNLQQQPD